MKIILASSSPSRARQLSALHIPFTQIKPEIDEQSYIDSHPADPQKIALHLGFEKAQKISKLHPEAMVIGSDQLLSIKSEILGKGLTRPGTKNLLEKLSGHTHKLYTSLVVVTPQKTFQHLETVTLHMRALSTKAIEEYIEIDEPFECAGGYKFESAGAALFERIESDDPSAIVGLPLITLTSIFLELGMGLPFQKRKQ